VAAVVVALNTPKRKNTMKTMIWAVVCAVFWAFPAQADQKLVPPQSEISFISTQMGVPVEGKFRQFDAKVAFDPQKPEAAHIAFTIDLTSATLGVPETDAELKKPEWFNTQAVAQATFTSTKVKALAKNKFEVSGKLTLKSIAQNVVVPVLLTQTGNNTVAVGTFSIKRLDFKIGDGDWKDTSVVADAVQVKLKLTLTGVPPL
jgi:polyisoprenoid-binding protein YceI